MQKSKSKSTTHKDDYIRSLVRDEVKKVVSNDSKYIRSSNIHKRGRENIDIQKQILLSDFVKSNFKYGFVREFRNKVTSEIIKSIMKNL